MHSFLFCSTLHSRAFGTSVLSFISHSDSSGSPLPDLSVLFDSLPGPSRRSGNSSPRERELFTPNSLLSEPQLLQLGMDFQEAGQPWGPGQVDANAPTPDGPAPRPLEAPQQPLSAGGASGAGPSRPPPPKRSQCQVGGTADGIRRPGYLRNNRQRRRRRRWDSWHGPRCKFNQTFCYSVTDLHYCIFPCVYISLQLHIHARAVYNYFPPSGTPEVTAAALCCLLIEFPEPALSSNMAKHTELYKCSSNCMGFCVSLGEKFFQKGIHEVDTTIVPMLKEHLRPGVYP